ncbi:alpha-ribazole phosphatase [Fusibacter ferrireducens]|uniref:Alpha-ribazole phosphatase n=1 Tax=Fusibacter ferrireducens TaxID=2785058 RepID=A0ABR9ZU94_9FIRM|nr:alpha-ribazole phosphatase [Fusibacter ferrireducens]MBF4694032.1 alpha-ribazole phosphatase [Fusibacter ferrireducens]
MNIYLIRHGETYANENSQFAGFWDVELNEKGKIQAEVVAEKLKDTVFDKIFVSDLQRAQNTCAAIARNRDVTPIVTENLREMNFGNWEGLKFEDIKARDPELLKQWFEDYKHFKVPGGESTAEMYERVTRFFKSVLSDYNTEEPVNLLFVAHGGVIQALLSYVCHGALEGYWQFRVENCGINRIEYVMGMPVIYAINK